MLKKIVATILIAAIAVTGLSVVDAATINQPAPIYKKVTDPGGGLG